MINTNFVKIKKNKSNPPKTKTKTKIKIKTTEKSVIFLFSPFNNGKDRDGSGKGS